MNNALVKYFVRYASLLGMMGTVWYGFTYFKGMADTPWSIVIAIGLFVITMNVFTGTLDDTKTRDRVRKLCYVALVALLVFLNVFRSMFWV